MDCELAKSLAQHADGIRSRGVQTLLVSSVYEVREARIAGASKKMMSRHALGLGLDVRAFITDDGARLSVLCDYDHPTVQAVESYLHEARGFRAVVSPGNERGHRNHIHLSAKLEIDGFADDMIDVSEKFERRRRRHRVQQVAAVGPIAGTVAKAHKHQQLTNRWRRMRPRKCQRKRVAFHGRMGRRAQ